MLEVSQPVALITGAARRIGATTARLLHAENYNVIIQYRNNKASAERLVHELNSIRSNSAISLHANLNSLDDIDLLAANAKIVWGKISLLINNASSFYPTTLPNATEAQWNDLMNSNAKAPFFLTQALLSTLKAERGCVINIADIHADRPLANHTIYCMAKAANVMLTKSLAKDLAPYVRVNGIAPGAIMWPESLAEVNEAQKKDILDKIPMQRTGVAEDIANTVIFLATKAPYVTGQIIAVDGGRSVSH